ncbi:hypothetical protein SAMN05216275_122109 [Streptosporangium canum]|uniref:Uncharacterized protein n=1 Tax=Streptosporangium canum TaxID=324952 RepID=A0A1I3YMA3_9ACTN|nr:hypothetical protein [Streptosporangium canum]SFK32962.1 hypothetical protein SAMN05216275_122109 [Streptosporangium canum]
MVTAANRLRAAMSARSDATHRTRPADWVLRAIVSAHVVAIAGQPVFAGMYMSGDYDGLRRHAAGADVVTSVGLVQVIVGIVIWVRLRQAWPFLAASALMAAESVQYFAGLDGALWLHFPLGVMTVVALVVLFIAVWSRPLRRRPHPRRERVRNAREPERQGAGDA